MKFSTETKTVVTTIPPTFGAVYVTLWGFSEPLGLKTGVQLWLIFISVSLVLSIGIIGVRQWFKIQKLWIKIQEQNRTLLNDQYVKINDPNMLKEHLFDISILRIFASGSETYRTLLLSYLGEIPLKRKLEIRILIRDDNSGNRKEKISEAKAKWKTDIDANYNTSTAIKTYNSCIMLRGLIFESKSAILGWYCTNKDGTQGQNIPAQILNKEIENSKKVLDFAIKTFDELYEKGNNVRQ